MNMFDKNIERPEIIKWLSDESIRESILIKLSDSNIDEVRKIDYEIFLQLFEYIFELEKRIEVLDLLNLTMISKSTIESTMKTMREAIT